jgi:hypothetical protein
MIYLDQLTRKDVLQVLEEWGWEPGKCKTGNNDVSMVAYAYQDWPWVLEVLGLEPYSE